MRPRKAGRHNILAIVKMASHVRLWLTKTKTRIVEDKVLRAGICPYRSKLPTVALGASCGQTQLVELQEPGLNDLDWLSLQCLIQ